jgi:hypothetical protein
MEDNASVTDSLSYSLLLLCKYAKGKILEEGIRAVAHLMKEETHNEIAESLKNKIIEKLNPTLEKVALLEDQLNSAAKRLYTTYEEARDEMHRTAGAITEAADNLATVQIPDLAQNQTYANAVLQAPANHQRAIEKEAAKKKQILIDKEVNSDFNVLELTEQQLVTKANLAMDKMNSEEKPENARFIGAKILQNGGVVFEVNRNEVAEWIQSANPKQDFESCFGGVAQVKARLIPVIVDYCIFTTNSAVRCHKGPAAPPICTHVRGHK